MVVNLEYPKQGDIWWTALDPTVGSEIKKTRPCVIVSIDVVNQYRRTVLAVPFSSASKENPPITVKVTCQGKKGVAIVDQLRAVSKERLKGFIERLDVQEFQAIIRALATITES